VLEFASKRHLKAILRYALRQQTWSPFDPLPYEFVDMNFDFHPDWMRDRLTEAGFHVKHQRSVSHFRLPILKRLLPASVLATLDGLCQPTGALWQLTPSVFAQCTMPKPARPTPVDDFLCCPVCRRPGFEHAAEALICLHCARRWPIEDGIYDFKSALAV
jgi:hypothetical protein